MHRFKQLTTQVWEGERLGARTAVVVAFVVLLVFLLIAPTGSAGSYNGTATLAQSGRVTGTINCSEDHHADDLQGHEYGHMELGLAGIKVWLLGTSFTAVTDKDGSFAMDYVPKGTYTLAVVTTGQKIRAVVENVRVPKQSVVVVDTINVTGGCGGCSGGGDGGGHDMPQ